MRSKNVVVLLLVLAIAVLVGLVVPRLIGGLGDGGPSGPAKMGSTSDVVSADEGGHMSIAAAGDAVAGSSKSGEQTTETDFDGDGDDAEEANDDGADPADKLVDAFDALVDKWMEPKDTGVTLADSDAFAAAFRALPEARRDECLHRALNLVPDDNVMLLVGILMDKSFGNDLVELVYNDILNRDEEVKKPILQEIFKDRSHPCWADTAWILDVTGETPNEAAAK